MSQSSARVVVAILVATLLFEAGFVSPSPVAAEDPPSSPSQQPAPTPTPDADPDLPPVDGSIDPPGVERPDMRTESSKTFEQADGTFVSQFFSDAVFYQPEGSSELRPIDLTFRPSTRDGAVVAVDDAPVRTLLSGAADPAGFLRVEGGGHQISLGLPATVAADGEGSLPIIDPNGFVEYNDFLPGGIGLRVFPRDDGFKTFLVLPARPAANTFNLRLAAPGLIVEDNGDGSFSFRDQAGTVVGLMPRPFMLDSSEFSTPEGEGRGGGVYSEAVTQSVTPDGDGWLLTLTVDQAFLDAAVYPVYVDPTTTTFPTGSTTAADTFANSQAPNTNFNTYQRPDSPFYHEMWHGRTPDTTYYNEVYIRFNDLAETLGSGLIESASLQMYPYWQFNHSEWKESWVERVSEDWTAGTLKWNNRPATDLTIDDFTSKEDVWTNWDLKTFVQDVVNGTVPNYGVMIHANSLQNGGWKRFVSRNDSSNLKPKLVVTWSAFAAPTVVYPNGGGETSSRTLSWALPASSTQTSFEAQIATNSAFTTGLVSSGTVTNAIPAWMIPTTTSLVEGTTYYWRVKVKYGVNTTFSGWATYGTFLHRLGATLGLPGHNAFESFDLGNADSASVNVSTGNLAISHPIVSLPVRGGGFGLSLTYNSHSTVNAGTGPGWRLTTTRRLTELANGNVVFTSGDGSVHTFVKGTPSGTSTPYTRPSTVYATLTKDTSWANEWKLVYRDQSVDEFNLVGSEGLLAKQADRHGNAVTFAYYSGTNRLQTATDPAGRVVDFAWNTGASPARLTTITDWAYVSGGVVQSTATGSRREYRLFYDSNGYLIGWSNPLNTSGSCPTMASNLTCLTYTSNLLTAITKRQTIATLSGGAIGTSSRDVSTQVLYRGNEVAEVRDPEQANAGAKGTTFTRIADKQLRVVRQGAPSSTTTYGYVSSTDSLGRVESVWRILGATDIEQLTTWNTTYPTERASVADNADAALSTPARTVSYTYVASSMGLLDVMTEPLTGSTNRTTDYYYNANNDVTQVVVASGASSTTTRYCYTSSGCSTSATDLTQKSVIENYVDGSKGGSGGNATDVTTDYQYDAYGQMTRETRWNYNAAGTLLDSRAIAYEYDANGNQTKVIANYVNGDSYDRCDSSSDPTTGPTADLTTVFCFDSAGNQVSSADPRRALGTGLHADSYVTRSEYDALNQQTKSTAPRDPADSSAPMFSTSVYDELGALRQTTDFGGLVAANEFDRAGRATRTFEDVDGAGGTAGQATSITTYDAAGRALTSKDRNQVGNSNLGTTSNTYDELGRLTAVVDASSSSPDVSSATNFAFDALDRQTSLTVGGVQTTITRYDLGGRAIETDDEFSCSTATFDYRDLALTETTGQDSGNPCTNGADKRVVTNTYDGLGRLTRSEVTAGTDSGDRTFDVTLDAAGRQLTSAVKKGGVTSTTTFTLNSLDQVTTEARPDGSTAKSNHDAAGNATDRCYWKPSITVGSCLEEGHTPWTNPPTQVTTSAYDARDSRIELRDSLSGSITTYDPDHNYQVKAFYVPTGSGREHQTLYGYDTRHRLTSITQQLCVISSGHSCSSTTATGSDSYAYDDNDNRTTVNESNGSASGDRRYCYDAQNRLQYRNTGTACSSSSKDEAYTYDDAGNRLSALVGGSTTNYAYDIDNGQLCKVGATTCGTPNVTYDSAGRTWSLSGWVFEYDSEGRLVRACESTSSCTGSIDKVEFSYDGEGHRTQTKQYTAGTLTTTRDFRYQGDAIVEESTNGAVSRGYVVGEDGRIVRFCDPSCASPTTSYLVTWNGHGDALATWRINGDGTLTLANSYIYSSWGAPTTATHNSIPDLGFRFLYVGAYDVQWDNFSGLGLHYMHARHYSPATGRFLQPDPARAESNAYTYAANNPISKIDPSGRFAIAIPVALLGLAALWEFLKLALVVGVVIVAVVVLITEIVKRMDDGRRCFVIGEGQWRVNTFASRYNCSTMFWIPGWVPSREKLILNATWLVHSMTKRKVLYDIGRMSPSNNSVYYAMERMMTSWYHPRRDLPGWMP